MAEYKLLYFNARGRAEAIRYIMAYAGQKYEDSRISQRDWQLFKPRTVFGQVPVLEISDGKNVFQLAQTLAISRYLGHKFDLMGRNDLENAKGDMIAEQVFDILNLYNAIRFELNLELREERLRQFWSETLPYYVGLFEKLFSTSKTVYVASDKLTWVDFVYAAFFDLIGEQQQAPLFERYLCCKTMFEKVEALPEIVKWKQLRPPTEL